MQSYRAKNKKIYRPEPKTSRRNGVINARNPRIRPPKVPSTPPSVKKMEKNEDLTESIEQEVRALLGKTLMFEPGESTSAAKMPFHVGTIR